jgi:hypothetical protein
LGFPQFETDPATICLRLFFLTHSRMNFNVTLACALS